MARKRHTAEEIVAKLRQVDVLKAQGRRPEIDELRAAGNSSGVRHNRPHQHEEFRYITPEQLLESVRTNNRLRHRVDAILRECFDRAESILRGEKDRLRAMAVMLSEKRHLNAEEIANHSQQAS